MLAMKMHQSEQKEDESKSLLRPFMLMLLLQQQEKYISLKYIKYGSLSQTIPHDKTSCKFNCFPSYYLIADAKKSFRMVFMYQKPLKRFLCKNF